MLANKHASVVDSYEQESNNLRVVPWPLRRIFLALFLDQNLSIFTDNSLAGGELKVYIWVRQGLLCAGAIGWVGCTSEILRPILLRSESMTVLQGQMPRVHEASTGPHISTLIS